MRRLSGSLRRLEEALLNVQNVGADLLRGLSNGLAAGRLRRAEAD